MEVLAAKAGAKHVYAIEASGLAVKARENIFKNGFKDQITYVFSLRLILVRGNTLGDMS
jgi:protein arginine N-methyltransferase 3